MVWFKVDDNLAFHQKTLAAGNAAMGLWVRAGSWSAQHLTDGFIPDHMIATLGTPAQKAKLVAARLWTVVPGGCQFHGWNDSGRQPTSKSVLAKREAAAARQAKHRAGVFRVERDGGASRDATSRSLASATTEAPGDIREHLALASSLQYGRTVDGILNDSDGLFPGDPQVDAASNAVTPPLVTPSVTGVVTPTPTRPDPKNKKNTLAPLAESDAAFDRFYATYPRRQDRRAAERAWKAALKRGAQPDAITAAAAAYALACNGRERRFIKLPATWLNAASYDDEPEPAQLRVVNGSGYQPYRNPADASAYDAPLLSPTSEDR